MKTRRGKRRRPLASLPGRKKSKKGAAKGVDFLDEMEPVKQQVGRTDIFVLFKNIFILYIYIYIYFKYILYINLYLQNIRATYSLCCLSHLKVAYVIWIVIFNQYGICLP